MSRFSGPVSVELCRKIARERELSVGSQPVEELCQIVAAAIQPYPLLPEEVSAVLFSSGINLSGLIMPVYMEGSTIVKFRAILEQPSARSVEAVLPYGEIYWRNDAELWCCLAALKIAVQLWFAANPAG